MFMGVKLSHKIFRVKGYINEIYNRGGKKDE